MPAMHETFLIHEGGNSGNHYWRRNLRLNSKTFDAVVTMTITQEIKIPVNSVAAVSSEGILGGKYVRLEPGTEKTYLAEGASLTKTKDFRSLEDQAGEIIFLATGGDKGGQ